MRQYEAETYYDQTGRIIFTPSKGLTGIGLPRKARKTDVAAGITYAIHSAARDEFSLPLGWEDVHPRRHRHQNPPPTTSNLAASFSRTVEYHAPFFRPDREADYRRAWAFFAEIARSDSHTRV